MRVLVCGGRTYRKGAVVFMVLDALHREVPIARLIHGGAAGADTLGGFWAERNRVPAAVYHADWQAHGKGAGFRRNQLMLEEGQPDLVVAFPGNRGTADMIKRAKAAGVMVMEVNEAFIERHVPIIAKVLSTRFNKRRKSDVQVQS